MHGFPTNSKVLSARNPFYFASAEFRGVGSPHTGYDAIWPMSIIMRAITSSDDSEIEECLDMLVSASAGTGFVHESFQASNASDFSRSWFAWANTLFGELILTLVRERPHLILLPTNMQN